MLKLTLEFNSPEEAIVALGKLMGGKVARAANQKGGYAPKEPNADAGGLKTDDTALKVNDPVLSVAAVLPPASAPAKQRKPRNDAGKKRGSYKNPEPVAVDDKPLPLPLEEHAPVVEPEQGVETPQDVPQVTHYEEPTPEVTAPPVAPAGADVGKAVETLYNEKGMQVCLDLLARYGVSRWRDLPADKGPEFCAEATLLLKA